MKKIGKEQKVKLLLAFLLMLPFGRINAQNEGEITIPLSEPGKKAIIEIDINYGGITVKGTSRQDVLVRYKGRESGDEASKSKDGLKVIGTGALDLEAYEAKNRIEIESDSWNKAIDLEVEIPINSDVHLSTYNSGDIYAENITGEVVAENQNGKITLMNISGSAVGDTYNGEVRVTFDKVTPGVPMSFTTYNGDVDITFPAGTKANMKMKTSRGEIYSGFDIEITKKEPIKKTDPKKGVYKVYLDDWTMGKINGGGAEVTMKNYNGDIYVRSK